MEENKLEVWQRGPVENVPFLLQPVAHALMQADEEVTLYMKDFPATLLWEKPAGLASVAFHLMHISGVIERLFTYAEDLPLTTVQKAHLEKEGIPGNPAISAESLVETFSYVVRRDIKFLENTDENSLFETRHLGRARIPTTKLGLLFHAAEHTMRHLGQLLVTSRILKHQWQNRNLR